MNTQQLFDALSARSLRVARCEDGQLEVIGDLSQLTDDMKQALRDNRHWRNDTLRHLRFLIRSRGRLAGPGRSCTAIR